MSCVSALGGASLHLLPTLFIFPQTQDEEAVAIVALNTCVFDRAGELHDFFEAAVGNFQLVMRDAVTAKAVAAQAAHAQQPFVNSDFDVFSSDSGQVDLHQPAVRGPIYIGGRIPQSSRRAPVTRVVTSAKEPLERSFRHISVPAAVK